MATYAFSRKGDEVKFSCDNEKIMNDIVDYIKRYIDAQNYRDMMHRVHKVEWELDQDGWFAPESEGE